MESIRKVKRFLFGLEGRSLFVFNFSMILGYLTLWLVSFWPGIMTFDSIAEWGEAINNSYGNWHPVPYALLMRFFYVLFRTPAALSVFQIMLFALTISWAVYELSKASKVGLVKFLPLVMIILFPFFGIFNITLWKDIIFADLTLFFAVSSYLFFIKRGKEGVRYLLAATISLCLLVVFRHNGLVLLLPALLGLILTKKGIKLSAIMLLTPIIFLVIFKGPIATGLKVIKTTVPAEQVRLKVIAAAYHYDADLYSTSEKGFLYELQPKEYWDNSYRCVSIDPLTFNKEMLATWPSLNSFGPSSDKEKISRYHQLFNKAMLQSPQSFVRDKACSAFYVFGIKYGQNTYANHTPANEIGLYSNPPSQLLNRGAKKILALSVRFPQRLIFWGGWLWAIVAAFYSFKFFIYRKWPEFSMSIVGPIMVASVFIGPASDFRYIYPAILCTMILPLLPVRLTEKEREWNQLDHFLSWWRARSFKKYIKKDSVICDIGCGNGQMLSKLSSCIKIGHGIDQGGHIARSITKKYKNLIFHKIDAEMEPLPLKKGSVDTVLLIAVLEHLNDPKAVLSEAIGF